MYNNDWLRATAWIGASVLLLLSLPSCRSISGVGVAATRGEALVEYLQDSVSINTQSRIIVATHAPNEKVAPLITAWIRRGLLNGRPYIVVVGSDRAVLKRTRMATIVHVSTEADLDEVIFVRWNDETETWNEIYRSRGHGLERNSAGYE